MQKANAGGDGHDILSEKNQKLVKMGSNLMPEENKNEGNSSNYDAITDDLSSVSHGLANKMLPNKTPIRPSMMKEHEEMPTVEVESDEDDDFFDALETFQASTYQKSVAKPRAQSRIP